MGSAIFRAGTVLARGADLTVLPCSDKGHISAETRSHLERYGLPLPGAVTFGSIQVIPFPGPSSITSWIAYAASVSNRSSVVAAIGRHREQARRAHISHPHIRVIESPLLGTGVGGLDVVEAGSSLRQIRGQRSFERGPLHLLLSFISRETAQRKSWRDSWRKHAVPTSWAGVDVFIAPQQ